MMNEECYEERVLSILRGRHGWDDEYDEISQLKQHLNEEASLTEEKLRYGWVLWRPNDSNQHKIITLLKHMACTLEFRYHYLVQFWAVVGAEGRQLHHLTTSHQPFCVGDLKKGLSWYRKLCMDHVYEVGEGAEAEQLGGVGRAYRNKHPESTPDLMLYSTDEFPLRDLAAGCGLRGYLALPLFDLHRNECYGVLELLSGYTTMRRSLLSSLNRGLQIAELRSTHINFNSISRYMTESDDKYKQQPESEITTILELAIKAVPELLLAQVWVPCKQCSKTNIISNLCCMERASFINSYNKMVNLYDGIDGGMFDYLQACEFHYLQTDFSYLGQHLCDLNICKNPLAHYIAKARLPLRFAVCLKSRNNEHYVIIEFFLQPKCGDSSLDLLLRIMDMKLKSFKVVHLMNPNSCDFIDHIVDVMNSDKERFSVSNFTKYLETVDLCCLRPSYWGSDEGWVFSRWTGEGISSNSLIVSVTVQEKIQHFMKKVAVKETYHDWIVQFWVPKMVERCYLEASNQPFALGSLAKGLASFRKKCMQHHYFVDQEAREEELGPPGRVFRNGHPEITPDHLLYTTREFSLRNHAMHCCRRGYFVLPVFDEMRNHTCVGVLEFIGFSPSELGDIGRALEASKLQSTHHIHFRQRFIANHEPSNITNCRKSALAEVNEAFSVIIEIPQLHMAKLWVPYDSYEKCTNNAICMVLASSITDLCDDMPTKQVRQIHVQPRKGIIGMVLASEGKSCFCRNLFEFSIADQPLAHYERIERRDVCFAMCLQSSHTGELLYVVEFFLYRGPGTYEYLRSFMNFLLPIMEFELKSFKIASGKHFGDELVVEVIEFSEANTLSFSESNLLEVFPVKFKSVKYGRNEHQYTQHHHDQKVQSGSSATQAEQSINVGSSAFEKTSRGKRKTGLHLSLEVLKPHFGKKLKDAAEDLGVGRSTIKRACRDYGIDRWPYKLKHTKNPSLFARRSKIQLLDTSLYTNRESTQQLNIVQEETEKVVIKVRYDGDTIRFELCRLSLRVGKLFEEVAVRLNLKMGAFKLKYLDEDNEEILLTCDADLQLCPKRRTLTGKTCIQVFLQLISK